MRRAARSRRSVRRCRPPRPRRRRAPRRTRCSRPCTAPGRRGCRPEAEPDCAAHLLRKLSPDRRFLPVFSNLPTVFGRAGPGQLSPTQLLGRRFEAGAGQQNRVGEEAVQLPKVLGPALGEVAVRLGRDPGRHRRVLHQRGVGQLLAAEDDEWPAQAAQLVELVARTPGPSRGPGKRSAPSRRAPAPASRCRPSRGWRRCSRRHSTGADNKSVSDVESNPIRGTSGSLTELAQLEGQWAFGWRLVAMMRR